MPSQPGENEEERLGGFESGSRILTNFAEFSPGYEAMENMIYFFYEIIIFRLNKQKDDIRSSNVYFYFFDETVNSHNLGETTNHIGYLTFLLHSVMKTHSTNQNALTIPII